ncbi:hypothetical protein AMS68_001896 [Peltaster fructicola]|uniref:P/Homo B domain-containing protein n=1 Tax=Peltaster fructicola TaxID=286661 RepID=A0A6H0XP25_9PEZI|nr:hypothetical protein AMS68_001896 [Peltaster fructicola]
MKATSALVALVAALSQTASAAHQKRDYDAHDYYAVHLEPGVIPKDVSSHLGLSYEGPLGQLPNHHIFKATDRAHEYDHIKTAITDLKERRRKRDAAPGPHILDSILYTQKQDLSKRFPLHKRRAVPQQAAPVEDAVEKGNQIAARLGIEDPIFKDQWHLYNSKQLGHDINVTGVWSQGITGKNSTVCIVDDGLDMDSEDLRDNYFAAGSYDFNDQVPDPKPRLSDDHHGTRCAGEVAAGRNNVCGVGVAYDAKIAGERILSKIISDIDEATAMNYEFSQNHIYSCSWGPPDDGMSMEQPGILIRRAMVHGVQAGRDGRGSIYVFAIGNGAASQDNCNFDGYTNSIYSVSVGGIDRTGAHPYYSEACSAQLVVTYSSGAGDYIHTTDVGQNACADHHGGTSAAGPLVAGIYALMLQVNNLLTWRDIQWITVLTAVKLDQHSDWFHNEAVGKDFSHQFGYGKADAYAMVEMAKTWKNVKPQAWFFSPWQHVKHPIPQGDQGLASHFVVTEQMLNDANLERIEHVTVTMNVEHTRRGDLSVDLISPSGMVSHIATHRSMDMANAGYVDWTFMSVAHWGEKGVGDWTVIVKDTKDNEHTGNFTDWRLKLYGESKDGASQPLLPLPNADDDADHDREDANVATTSVAVPEHTPAPGNPDGHIDRPVNFKTSTADAAMASVTAPAAVGDDKAMETQAPTEASSSSTTTIATESTSTAATSATAAAQEASSTSNFLPKPFPTFGVSKNTQIWIYGASLLIVIFLVVLGAYLYYMRRKKAWMARDKYAFEMVETEDLDAEGNRVAGNGNGGLGQGRRKRAGELYDAFAEASDEDEFDLGEDSQDEEENEAAPLRSSREQPTQQYRDNQPHQEKPGGA